MAAPSLGVRKPVIPLAGAILRSFMLRRYGRDDCGVQDRSSSHQYLTGIAEYLLPVSLAGKGTAVTFGRC